MEDENVSLEEANDSVEETSGGNAKKIATGVLILVLLCVCVGVSGYGFVLYQGTMGNAVPTEAPPPVEVIPPTPTATHTPFPTVTPLPTSTPMPDPVPVSITYPNSIPPGLPSAVSWEIVVDEGNYQGPPVTVYLDNLGYAMLTRQEIDGVLVSKTVPSGESWQFSGLIDPNSPDSGLTLRLVSPPHESTIPLPWVVGEDLTTKTVTFLVGGDNSTMEGIVAVPEEELVASNEVIAYSTYTSTGGFSFSYPEKWVVRDDDSGTVTITTDSIYQDDWTKVTSPQFLITTDVDGVAQIVPPTAAEKDTVFAISDEIDAVYAGDGKWALLFHNDETLWGAIYFLDGVALVAVAPSDFLFSSNGFQIAENLVLSITP
jgi:hypothetical protein